MEDEMKRSDVLIRTADQIAAKLGIEKTALIRVRAGISFALAEAMDDGHCGLPADELILLAQKLLEVPPDLVETALGLETHPCQPSPFHFRVGLPDRPFRALLGVRSRCGLHTRAVTKFVTAIRGDSD
jgi:hypothetical protein